MKTTTLMYFYEHYAFRIQINNMCKHIKEVSEKCQGCVFEKYLNQNCIIWLNTHSRSVQSNVHEQLQVLAGDLLLRGRCMCPLYVFSSVTTCLSKWCICFAFYSWLYACQQIFGIGTPPAWLCASSWVLGNLQMHNSH